MQSDKKNSKTILWIACLVGGIMQSTISAMYSIDERTLEGRPEMTAFQNVQMSTMPNMNGWQRDSHLTMQREERNASCVSVPCCDQQYKRKLWVISGAAALCLSAGIILYCCVPQCAVCCNSCCSAVTVTAG